LVCSGRSLSLDFMYLKNRSTGFSCGEYCGVKSRNAFIRSTVLVSSSYRWMLALSMSSTTGLRSKRFYDLTLMRSS
jgi:hypothetical protein